MRNVRVWILVLMLLSLTSSVRSMAPSSSKDDRKKLAFAALNYITNSTDQAKEIVNNVRHLELGKATSNLATLGLNVGSTLFGAVFNPIRSVSEAVEVLGGAKEYFKEWRMNKTDELVNIVLRHFPDLNELESSSGDGPHAEQNAITTPIDSMVTDSGGSAESIGTSSNGTTTMSDDPVPTSIVDTNPSTSDEHVTTSTADSNPIPTSSNPTSTADTYPTSTIDSNPTSTPDSTPTSTIGSNPTLTPDSTPTSTIGSNPTSTPDSNPTSIFHLTPDSSSMNMTPTHHNPSLSPLLFYSIIIAGSILVLLVISVSFHLCYRSKRRYRRVSTLKQSEKGELKGKIYVV